MLNLVVQVVAGKRALEFCALEQRMVVQSPHRSAEQFVADQVRRRRRTWVPPIRGNQIEQSQSQWRKSFFVWFHLARAIHVAPGGYNRRLIEKDINNVIV